MKSRGRCQEWIIVYVCFDVPLIWQSGLDVDWDRQDVKDASNHTRKLQKVAGEAVTSGQERQMSHFLGLSLNSVADWIQSQSAR